MRPQDLLMEAPAPGRRVAPPPGGAAAARHDLRGRLPTLAERLADIPDEVNRILRLFDGVRTFLQVIDDCGLPDLDAAASIGKLVHERIIHRHPPAARGRRGGRRRHGGVALRGDRAVPLAGAARTRSVRCVPGGGDRPCMVVRPLRSNHSRGRPTRSMTICERASPTGSRPRSPRPEGAGSIAGAIDQPRSAGCSQHAARVRRSGVGDDLGRRRTGGGRDGSRGRSTALESSLEAAASGRRFAHGRCGRRGRRGVDAEISSPNAEDAILSSEDATPIMDVAVLDETLAPTSPGAEPPASAAAALPIGPEQRSASGEIVVRPAKTKIKHSPAAEVRLAHLREENARAFIRPSQSVTPPGSAPRTRRAAAAARRPGAGAAAATDDAARAGRPPSRQRSTRRTIRASLVCRGVTAASSSACSSRSPSVLSAGCGWRRGTRGGGPSRQRAGRRCKRGSLAPALASVPPGIVAGSSRPLARAPSRRPARNRLWRALPQRLPCMTRQRNAAPIRRSPARGWLKPRRCWSPAARRTKRRG